MSRPNLLYELERIKRTSEWKSEFEEFCAQQEALEEQNSAGHEAIIAALVPRQVTPRAPRKPRLIPKLRILPPRRASLPRATKRSNPGSSATPSEQDSEPEDDDYELPPAKRRRRDATTFTTYTPPPSTSAVTPTLLANIAVRVSDKVYSQISGTTCHQCRQKTLDTKTICRSGRCVGVRGNFCQICLHNRYGENVADALLDENWKCPDCRGICNASICRRRMGLLPTGPLYPNIGSHDSVRDFLKAAGEEEGMENDDDDESNKENDSEDEAMTSQTDKNDSNKIEQNSKQQCEDGKMGAGKKAESLDEEEPEETLEYDYDYEEEDETEEQSSDLDSGYDGNSHSVAGSIGNSQNFDGDFETYSDEMKEVMKILF